MVPNQMSVKLERDTSDCPMINSIAIRDGAAKLPFGVAATGSVGSHPQEEVSSPIVSRIEWIWKPVKKRNFDNILAKFLGDIAQYSHDNSWKVLLWTFILTAGLGCGFIGQETSISVTERYSPSNSVTVDILNRFEDYYGYEPRAIIISARADELGANVLTVEYLKQFQRLYTEGLNPLTTKVNGQDIMMKDFCNQVPAVHKTTMNNDSICLTASLLGVFGFNESSLSQMTDKEIISKVNERNLVDVFGYNVDVNQVLGGIRYDETDNIIGASTLVIFFYINSTDRWKVNKLADKWEMELLDVYKTIEAREDFNFKLNVIGIRIIAESITESEFEIYVIFAFGGLLCAVYSVFVFTDLRAFDLVVSQVNLIIYGTLSIACSLVSGIGFIAYFGIPWSSEMPLCIFLCLGLGFDDCYLVTYDYNRLPPELESSVRVRRSMELAGTSITLTSFTDFVAFVIGTGFGLTVNFPVMTNFCIYGSSCILFLWIYMIWMFTALLSIDSRRQEAGRWDILCCFGITKDETSGDGDTKLGLENRNYKKTCRRDRTFEADVRRRRRTGSFSYLIDPNSDKTPTTSGERETRASREMRTSKQWTDDKSIDREDSSFGDEDFGVLSTNLLEECDELTVLGKANDQDTSSKPSNMAGYPGRAIKKKFGTTLTVNTGYANNKIGVSSIITPSFSDSVFGEVNYDNRSKQDGQYPSNLSKQDNQVVSPSLIHLDSTGSTSDSLVFTPFTITPLNDKPKKLSVKEDRIRSVSQSSDTRTLVKRNDILGYFIGEMVRCFLEIPYGAATITCLFFLYGGFNAYIFLESETQYSFDMTDSLYLGTEAFEFYKMWEHNGTFAYDLLESLSWVVFELDPYNNLETFNKVREEIHEIEGIAFIGGWVWSFEYWLSATYGYERNNQSAFTQLTYEDYLSNLINFLRTDGIQYARDVILSDSSHQLSIESSRLLVINLITDSNTKIRRLKNLREACRRDDSPICYPYAEYYAYADGLLQVTSVVYTNALTAMGCMFIIVWFALGSFFWATFLTFVIALIAIDFLGTMFLIGSYDDQFKAMGVAMAFGFTVDFNMHLVHRFVHGDSNLDPSVRTVKAIRQIGGATFNGAFSTLLVMLPAVFFPAVKLQQRGSRTFSIIILIGLAHSLFLVPSLLMLSGMFMMRHMRDKPEKVIHDGNTNGQFLVPVWHTVGGTPRKKRAQSVQLAKEHLEAKTIRRSRVRKSHSVMLARAPKTIEMSILKNSSIFTGLDRPAIGHTIMEETNTEFMSSKTHFNPREPWKTLKEEGLPQSKSLESIRFSSNNLLDFSPRASSLADLSPRNSSLLELSPRESGGRTKADSLSFLEGATERRVNIESRSKHRQSH